MRLSILIVVSLCSNLSFGQVFNYGSQDLAFKNMLANGVTFIKTGNEEFDSTMLDNLDKYWTICEFSFVERYKRPLKESTALFVTTKTKTKKHVMDRKNQHILVLQPAVNYHKDKTVPFDQTLGYMYYNGFYELIEEDEEYLFNRYVIQALNKGLTIIKEKKFHNRNQEMNDKIALEIIDQSKGLLGNTLLLNREQLVHFIDIKKVETYGITHRLFAKDEFYKSIETSLRTHYILYYSVNTKTELSLINVLTGEMIYTKHFEEGYTEIKPKELKLFAPYF